VVEPTAGDPDGLARLRAARAHARARAWAAGAHPGLELLVVDADATLVLAHSDAKQGAAGTYKHSFGFAPLLAYLDRGQAPGEPLAGLLRPGNAAPGAANDLIVLVELALAQLPAAAADQPVLVRSDSAGASTRLAWHLGERGVGCSLGMPIDATSARRSWPNPRRPGPGGRPRWPTSQRRRGVRADRLDRPAHLAARHPAAVPPRGRPPRRPAALQRPRRPPLPGLGHRPARARHRQLELRHRQRARVEDRLRAAKATGRQNLPFDRWRRNSVWLELVLAAQDLTCWTQALLLEGALAVAEPKALR
jgi:Transposase DDE domain group 1